MATFPLPFIPNAPEGNNIVDAPSNVSVVTNQFAPEGNNIVDAPQAVPATTGQFANTQFSTSFRPQAINTSVEVQPDYYNAQFENEVDFTNTGSDLYANTPYAKNFRAPNVNQEPFPKQPDYTYNPENFSGDPNTGNPPTTAGVQQARASGSNQNGAVELDRVNISGASIPDSRIRMHISAGSNYLYNAEDPGILAPLKRTGGVIFPYRPTINVIYTANYEQTDIVHTNYKTWHYKNSNVGDLQITAKFSAQDQIEATYLLAAIHFFRSATKMFYGLDLNPTHGTPPPLCFLSGYGDYMFDNHPLVISNFTLNLPADVDYIEASRVKIARNAQTSGAKGGIVGGTPTISEPGFTPYNPPVTRQGSSFYRLQGSGLNPGATKNLPQFTTMPESDSKTLVPTLCELNITCHPMITRKDISNYFSFKDYATGKLLRAADNRTGKGMW